MEPVTATLPVAPGKVHSGVPPIAGIVDGHEAASVAVSAMDGTLNGSAADVDVVADDVSVSEPHAASIKTKGAADAAMATVDIRVKLTVATVQPLNQYIDRGDEMNMPEPFVVHDSLLHGTKADLAVGDVLVPGRQMNYDQKRVANHVYVTRTLDAAVWGAELASGDGPGRIYIVEPDGPLEDDPNVTDKKHPGNPTHSYRTREPVRIVGELTDWVGHTPEQLQTMRETMADLARRGLDVIYD